MLIEPHASHGGDKTNEYTGENGRERPPDTISHDSAVNSAMDPFSVTLGAVALAGSALTTTSRVQTVHSNYKNAVQDYRHIEGQRKNLKLNKSLLNEFGSNFLDTFQNDLKSSLEDLEAGLSNEPCLEKKRNKLRWAALGGKQKVQEQIAKLKEIESSAMLSLLLMTLSKWEEISDSIKTFTEKMSESDQKLALYEKQLELLEACPRVRSYACNSRHSASQEALAEIYYWNWIANLGVSLQLIMTCGDFFNIYTILLRWPLFFNVVLTWRMRVSRGFPCGFYFNIRPRTEIPSDSPIIRACQRNDLTCIKQLLSESISHVKDVTSDNLTLLHFAIHAGHAEVVELLLDSGADPNQTFGQKEKSPLNDAFFLGHADIVRLLLKSKFRADLDYINKKGWTSVYYLWDPQQPHHSSVSEILDICGNHSFQYWNTRDSFGWAPIHRAAAFGQAEHINKLFNMRVVDTEVVDPSTAPLAKLGWSPIQCAVCYGNISTFECLVEHAAARGVSFKTLAKAKDKRGWNLHLAAASGSEGMMALLLEKGFDPNSDTDYATFGLPETLRKRLKPRDIAEFCGYTAKFDNVLQAFSAANVMPAT